MISETASYHVSSLFSRIVFRVERKEPQTELSVYIANYVRFNPIICLSAINYRAISLNQMLYYVKKRQ